MRFNLQICKILQDFHKHAGVLKMSITHISPIIIISNIIAIHEVQQHSKSINFA